jgi:hypothetical protein
VKLWARLTRPRRRNTRCDQRIFGARGSTPATPFARRTARPARIVRLFGHSAGGRPFERLMAELGMPVSATTIPRHVKERAAARPYRAGVRVACIDEWARRKGTTFGIVIVNLRRRRWWTCWSIASEYDGGLVQVVSRDRGGQPRSRRSLCERRTRAHRRRARSLTASTC